MVYWEFPMVFKIFRKMCIILFCILVATGFKIYPGVRGWQLDTSSTAGRKVFITMPNTGKTIPNNLPASDSLATAGTNLTEAQIIDSVMSDYNNIQASNLILVADTDSDFATHSSNHRIIIEQGSAAGLSSGEANPQFSGGTIISCKIQITPNAYEDAETFLHLVSHELGHCLGLDHPQETVYAVMSYFYDDSSYRLAVDDKMGIVHLYPKDSTYSKEKSTLGLSCSRQ
jgi:hypothetical protein